MVQQFSAVTAVTMDPPPEFVAAQTAYSNGDLQTAFKDDSAVAANFRGLPTDWARQAMLMLGDIYVGLNQIPKAQAAFADFQRAYPANKSDANVGLAGIDVANKNYAAAKEKIQPILDEAVKVRTAPRRRPGSLAAPIMFPARSRKRPTICLARLRIICGRRPYFLRIAWLRPVRRSMRTIFAKRIRT